jgi:hypothetical protein
MNDDTPKRLRRQSSTSEPRYRRPSSPTINRREHLRLEVDGPVLVVPSDRSVNRFWAATTNISPGGLFIQTDVAIPVYTEIRTKIMLRDGPTIQAQARVVRCEKGRGIGCCFVHMAERYERSLNSWLGRSGGLRPISGTILDD